MERDYHAKTQQTAPVRQILDKWRGYCAQVQATPEQAFDTLMQTEYVLRTGTPQAKLDMLMQVARTYHIDIAQPAGGSRAAAGEEDIDPIAASPVVQQLLASHNQVAQFLQQQAEGQQQQVVTQSGQAVVAFRDSRDASGKPAHPYFDEVANDMIALAHAEKAMGKTPTLDSLYDRAIWANPTVRAKHQAAEQHKAQKADQERKRKDAEKSRKAAVSITGAPSSIPDKPKTLEDTVAEAIRASA